MPVGRVLILLVLGTLLFSAQADAQGFIAPYVGTTFKPSVAAGGEEEDGEDEGYGEDNRFTYGGSLGAFGRAFGFEVDFSVTPEFFGDSDAFGDSNVTTLMFNILAGGGTTVRPYVTGGLGLMKLRLDGPEDLIDFDSNDLGVNLGGGLIGFFSQGAGIRGDVRYFRSMTDPEPDAEIDLDLGDFSYWRGTVGLVLRF